MGKYLFKLLMLSLLIFNIGYSGNLKITAEFYGAKLGTAIDALAKLSNKNVIWDISTVTIKNRSYLSRNIIGDLSFSGNESLYDEQLKFGNQTNLGNKYENENKEENFTKFVDGGKERLVSIKDVRVYVLIKEPISVDDIFRIILKNYGLTYVQLGNIYKITLADSYIFSVPTDVIENLGRDVYNRMLTLIKNNINSTAEIKEYPDSYSVYVYDSKDNLNNLIQVVSSYIEPLKRLSTKITKAKKEKELKILKERELLKKLRKKEVNITFQEFKDIEDELASIISDFGRYEYDKDKNLLIVYDFRDNIPKISNLIAKIKKVRIKTKCFYVRSLEPTELIMNIKKNYLSKYGDLIYTSKELESLYDKKIEKQSTITSTGINSSDSKEKEFNRVIKSLPRICITDVPEVINRIKQEYIGILLERPYQISIEARIVEIEKSYTKSLGVRWGLNSINSLGSFTYTIGSGSGSNFIFDFPAQNLNTGNGMVLGFSLAGLTERFDINLQALEDIGKSKVLSRPKIITIDGEPAEIYQGFEVPYQSSSANTGTNVEFKKAVLRLSVLPRTLPDGNIVMTITLTQDVPDFNKSINGQPPINTKYLTSKVVAKDGSTIVIGGVLEKKDLSNTKGVPGLLRVPILGWLFKNNYVVNTEKELLIFISPKIIYE